MQSFRMLHEKAYFVSITYYYVHVDSILVPECKMLTMVLQFKAIINSAFIWACLGQQGI